jgi:hypothetical protein
MFSGPALGNSLARLDASGKGRFDLPLAQAEVAISFGQGPHRRKMIGQDATTASRVNGWTCPISRKTRRSRSMRSINKRLFRSARFTVKK